MSHFNPEDLNIFSGQKSGRVFDKLISEKASEIEDPIDDCLKKMESFSDTVRDVSGKIHKTVSDTFNDFRTSSAIDRLFSNLSKQNKDFSNKAAGSPSDMEKKIKEREERFSKNAQKSGTTVSQLSDEVKGMLDDICKLGSEFFNDNTLTPTSSKKTFEKDVQDARRASKQRTDQEHIRRTLDLKVNKAIQNLQNAKSLISSEEMSDERFFSAGLGAIMYHLREAEEAIKASEIQKIFTTVKHN